MAEAVVLQLVKPLHVQNLSFQHQMKDHVLCLYPFLDPPSWGRPGEETGHKKQIPNTSSQIPVFYSTQQQWPMKGPQYLSQVRNQMHVCSFKCSFDQKLVYRPLKNSGPPNSSIDRLEKNYTFSSRKCWSVFGNLTGLLFQNICRDIPFRTSSFDRSVIFCAVFKAYLILRNNCAGVNGEGEAIWERGRGPQCKVTIGSRRAM